MTPTTTSTSTSTPSHPPAVGALFYNPHEPAWPDHVDTDPNPDAGQHADNAAAPHQSSGHRSAQAALCTAHTAELIAKDRLSRHLKVAVRQKPLASGAIALVAGMVIATIVR